MSAVAIFSCRPNSHPFLERHISLHEPVKVGRSVAKARPSPTNGTFDCKVLSRNHAMLWYSNGKFHLQDTKSSNGTFVNNQRLSKGSEESAPREIFSGDIIQFGVEVMENNRRGEKITHGCIIATVTLFHPDGREAKPMYPNCNTLLNNPASPGVTIQSQELYQLAQYLQEALHREQMLEQKLSALQDLVQHTQEASENGWQALIDEDRLLSRLEVLESQLNTYSKNHAEDTLRQELVALQDDKHHYETTAKESLRRVLQEKLEAVRKISDLEQSLGNTENECCYLKEITEKTQNDLKQLAEDYQEQRKEVEQLQEKLEEAERKHQEELEKIEKEKHELNEKLEEMTKQEKILYAKVESLQADNDISKEQLTAIKTKWENIKELEGDNKIIPLHDDISILLDKNKLGERRMEIIPITKLGQEPEEWQEKLRDTQYQIVNYKAKIQELETQLKESREKVEQIQNELDLANEDSNKYILKIAALEKKLQLSDMHMNQMVDNTMDNLKLQLKESQRQTDCSSNLNTHLVAEIEELESEWTLQRPEKVDQQGEKFDNDTLTHSPTNQMANHVDSEKPQLIDVEKLKEQLRKAEATTRDVKQQILDLRDQLEHEKTRHKETQDELMEKKRQLQEAQQSAKQNRNEAEQLRNKVKVLQEELETEKNTRQKDTHHGKSMHDSTHRPTAKSKSELNSLKEECTNLRKRIQAIEAEMKLSRKENLQLSSDYNKLQESYRELEALKDKLEHKEILWKSNMTDAQKEAEQAKQEMGQTKDLMGELTHKCDQYTEEVSNLRQELGSMLEDYRYLRDKSKLLSFISSIPLLILLFAVLLALYPTLEGITATSASERHPKNGLIGIANISSHLINWCLVSSWPTVCKYDGLEHLGAKKGQKTGIFLRFFFSFCTFSFFIFLLDFFFVFAFSLRYFFLLRFCIFPPFLPFFFFSFSFFFFRNCTKKKS
ncbi:Sarcolemmal membrane-associated protein [Acanthosepion pharaonis]|uniref:Sarcolemmal membrane-associated protein n=1 Tax=Acanthosepion pharaonis TaxID=158019 RepID=A0A812BU80_ACAPH|nr:Sarcolemmal membrane-associated protein [Sepia pharaonis]